MYFYLNNIPLSITKLPPIIYLTLPRTTIIPINYLLNPLYCQWLITIALQPTKLDPNFASHTFVATAVSGASPGALLIKCKMFTLIISA